MSDEKPSVIPGGSKLTLKPRDFAETAPVQKLAPLTKREKKKREKKQSRGRKLKPANESGKFSMRFLGQSIGSFLVGSLIFGLFLYHQATGMEILTPHQATLTRNIGLIAFTLVLILEAFTEDMMQGILCILFPYPYVYGLLFADVGPIRGLTVAILVFLGAEMYFTPSQAIVPQVAKSINAWIQTGQDKLIHPDGRPEAGFDRR